MTGGGLGNLVVGDLGGLGDLVGLEGHEGYCFGCLEDFGWPAAGPPCVQLVQDQLVPS